MKIVKITYFLKMQYQLIFLYIKEIEKKKLFTGQAQQISVGHITYIYLYIPTLCHVRNIYLYIVLVFFSIVDKTLLIQVKNEGQNNPTTMVKITDNKLRLFHWFAIGSNTIAHWTLYCIGSECMQWFRNPNHKII